MDFVGMNYAHRNVNSKELSLTIGKTSFLI